MDRSNLFLKAGAEFIGTFWLVLCGCGSAILAAQYPDVGIGLHGVALAFGLSVLTMAFAVGPVSGAHLNPAVSVGLFAAGRFPGRDLLPYVAAQVLGAIVASLCLYFIASGQPLFEVGTFAANGYGAHSPGGYGLAAGFFTELLFTFMFLFIIIGATGGRASAAFAPLAIGFALTLVHLVTIPVTNTSVNPARSTGPAFIVGGWAMAQLWLFWLAPLLGAAIAGYAYRYLSSRTEVPEAAKTLNPSPTLSPQH